MCRIHVYQKDFIHTVSVCGTCMHTLAKCFDPPQIKAEIEQFKSQGVEMEEKRKAILRGLEVSDTIHVHCRYSSA